jgi:Holliday junction DNA helicase RuvA
VIARLSGILIDKSPPGVVIDVGGVAYEVEVPMSTFYGLPATGQSATLLTHLVIREDAHLLYGFASEDERRTFRALLKISGVGARTALAVLSGMSVAELSDVIARQDSARLTRIPGIGKKTADRLLLELRGKFPTAGDSGDSSARGPGLAPTGHDVVQALFALGYSEKEALAAVKGLPQGLPVADGIRQALKVLAKA